ncbi:hypothetical protein Asulf_01419 [Archaeoglobus sulfaticallidus PM70-1]|uniref:Uncharacterized protein n=1 Tax=Archaeoglobus sulfaticallidus PM70-1 TaxID=387631 RepID=N0BLI9_9EURY|nr:hypothetical protein [Archaeoglobus sulfaticallidus]AGK61406.1 hypothetical protein Asulf_01419 [Archaeoglobus sulfaticallidus PM70-1]
MCVRNKYVNRVKENLLRFKNSLNGDLKEKVKETEKEIDGFVKEMDSNGYWRVVRFFRNILLFAYKKLEGVSIPWHNNWMEGLVGEISKRMKNKWMSWSAKGAKNLLNLLLRRYAKKIGMSCLFVGWLGKVIRLRLIPRMMKRDQYCII